MQRVLSSQAKQMLSQAIEVRGHVQAIRKLGNLAFLIIRDRSGCVQVVVEKPELLAVVEKLSPETPVALIGEVTAHPGNGGGVELQARSLELLAPASPPLPVEIAKNKKVDELSVTTLLDNRPLTLRNEKVRAIFTIEAAFCRGFRRFLTDEGFTEIHTPKIVSTGTEGGAQLFVLQYFEKQAYLAQSPQFYKQIMVGVFERVFEIGPVYRAEEHDTTRHLNEYVSMDLELGFIESEVDLMILETRLLRAMFAEVAATCQPELALHKAVLPSLGEIPAIKLADAIALLQSQCGWTPNGDATDLDPEGERLLCQHFQRTKDSEFVFVTHYPHAVRPFYAMPEAGTSLSHSFDLLYRGLEVTTGGKRIHEYEKLCASIRSRGLDPDRFADYLQCFKYGMPPHGGMAIGLERLTKQLLALTSVKQTALFPRDINRLTP